MAKIKKTIILTKDLLEGIIEYMEQEKVEALEFEEQNFLLQLQEHNRIIFGTPEIDESLH